MIKPQGYDNVQPYGEYTPLEAGGHICKIVKLEEKKNSNGRESVVIWVDTDKTDKQPNYFNNQYKNDKRNPKQWNYNAIKWELVYDADGFANARFVTFVKAVQASNPGFNIEATWGNEPLEKFYKGKLVGCIFGREQYEKDGVYKFSVRLQNFRNVEQIKQGVEVPKDKLLNSSSNNNSNTQDYGDMTPVENGGDLPF